jgi:hypothetical protein
MKKAVFGIAKSQEQANRIVEALQNAGFPEEDISVLLGDPRFSRANASHPSPNASPWDSENENLRRPREDTRQYKKTNVGYEKGNKSGDGAALGATAGGVLGGTLGLLAGLGTLAIPGVGPFLAAGPILAALSGSAIGGSVGLIAGALVGMGIPEYEAKRYEGLLKTGGVLISVHCENAEAVEEAKRILEENQAADVACSREKSGRRS